MTKNETKERCRDIYIAWEGHHEATLSDLSIKPPEEHKNSGQCSYGDERSAFFPRNHAH